MYFVAIVVDEGHFKAGQTLPSSKGNTAGWSIAGNFALEDLIQNGGSVQDLDTLGRGMILVIIVMIGGIAVAGRQEDEGKRDGKQARSLKKSRFHGSNR